MIDILSICSKAITWLAQALIIQLFILSLSFPVLVSWGIAFSPLVFLGNILFTPVLTVFLAISCLIYILELCYIPSDYLCTVLDALARLWLAAMAYSPPVTMIACPQAPLGLLLIMPLGAWVILRTYGFRNRWTTVACLTLWICVVFIAIKWGFTPLNKRLTVACGKRHVTLSIKDQKIMLIDNDSVVASRACSPAWINYTLSSELIKNFGTTTLDTIIVTQATPMTLVKLTTLCKRYQCKKVFDANGSALNELLQI